MAYTVSIIVVVPKPPCCDSQHTATVSRKARGGVPPGREKPCLLVGKPCRGRPLAVRPACADPASTSVHPVESGPFSAHRHSPGSVHAGVGQGGRLILVRNSSPGNAGTSASTNASAQTQAQVTRAPLAPLLLLRSAEPVRRTAAYFFFFGASTMIIWRPSILGNCSTWPWASRSVRRRSSMRMPISW